LESACKPDSVFVWRFLYAANPDGRRAASSRPYLALLPAGFAPGRLATDRRGLLPHDFTLTGRRASGSRPQETLMPDAQRPTPYRRFVSVALSIGRPSPVARGAVLCEVRTFLPGKPGPPPGQLRFDYE